MHIIHKVEKFFCLNGEEKRLFLEAYLTLGIMRAALLILPFKRIISDFRYGSPVKAEFPIPTKMQQQRADRIGRAICQASAYTPWQSTCLVQALAAGRMLNRRGIPGGFYLGVIWNHGMRAHAWSRCGDTIITGGKGYEKFTELSLFIWDGSK